jgi:hypothetical protein
VFQNKTKEKEKKTKLHMTDIEPNQKYSQLEG